MASSSSFHLAVALLLVLVHQQAGEPDDFDLDKAVETAVGRTAKRFGFEVKWWDLSHKEEEVKRKFSRIPPVTATAGDVEYGVAKSSASKPNIVYTQWFRNGQKSESLMATLVRTTVQKKTATWEVKAGFHFSSSLKASAKYYFVNFEGKIRTDVDLQGRYYQEDFEAVTFAIDVKVPVPPLKSVKIDWIITDTVKEVLWTSPVTVTGNYFLKIAYRNDPKGSLLASSLDFFGKDDLLKRVGNNTYLFNVEGTFKGVKAVRNDFRVEEYDYHAFGSNYSAIRTYTIPLSLTPYAPTAKTI